MMCLSREMFLLDLLRNCMGHRGCNHLIVPYYPPSREPGGINWTTYAPYEAILVGSHFSRQIKKWLNGYWRNRFGLLRQGNGMGWVQMMSVMSSTSSPAVVALGWAHIYFSGILYYFLELLEAHDFLKEAQFHSLKIILFLLCHGDTQRELVNTPWTHHVLHLFFC